MGRIVELSPNVNFEDVMATKGAGYKPDLRIFTSGIESDRTSDRLVHMVGSSTEKDLQGDYMSLYALSSMTKAAPNLTVWLNHSYDLPDSIFGSIAQTPAIQHYDGVADLKLTVDVELDNPAAAKVKRYIDNGRRLGCSIGCMVTKYEVPDETDAPADTWAMQPIIIHDVYVVEYSVVGIPANQRSWVENAIRGVFQRTLDPALAPAMKSLWPSVYKETLKSVNGDRRVELERTPDRPHTDTRLDWYTHKKVFMLTSGKLQQELSLEDVRSVLKSGTYNNRHTLATPAVEPELEEELAEELVALKIEDAALTEKGAIPNEVNPYGASDNSGYDADGDIDNSGQLDNSNGPMDAEGHIMLHKDGLNHDAWEGEHTHEHDAFGYEDAVTHTHSHTHLNDNNHNHDNNVGMGKEEKGMEPEQETLRAINKDGTEGLILKAGGEHEPYAGTHQHHHDSFGHGDVPAHTHDHFHSNDNAHAHDHSKTPMGENADSYYAAEPDKTAAAPVETEAVPAKAELDPMRAQFLASYNGFGKTLGLPEVTPEMLLLAEHPAIVKAVDPGMLQQLQSIHDTVSNASNGLVCANAGTVQELGTQATDATGGDVSQQMNVLNSMGERMGAFTKALDGLEGVLAMKKEASEISATVALARTELTAIFAEVKKASATLDALKTMPIGNPLNQHRSVTAQDGTVSHDELLGISGSQKATQPIATDSLAQALALTEVLSTEYANGQIMRYRHWPQNVGGPAIAGKGVRPPLTSNQISFMNWSDVVAYRDGNEAYVPYLDNQLAESK